MATVIIINPNWDEQFCAELRAHAKANGYELLEQAEIPMVMGQIDSFRFIAVDELCYVPTPSVRVNQRHDYWNTQNRKKWSR